MRVIDLAEHRPRTVDLEQVEEVGVSRTWVNEANKPDMPRTTTVPPHRSKGRPRTFDRVAALDRALNVFWRRGYEPASISELCAAMAINPPSLYAAFGNKAQLFMGAVQHYEGVYWDAAWARMIEVPDIHEAMSGFFKDAGRILTSQDAPFGCLVILAATKCLGRRAGRERCAPRAAQGRQGLVSGPA
jgi:AcrR family transcriptional regulator